MRQIIFILCLLFCELVSAQTDTVRYVKPAEYGGAYANNGRSWAEAKDNIQDAINDLHNYMTLNNLHGGSVYVAAGTYQPTEAVEGGNSGQLSTSFIIYDGIHVYGGFNPEAPESKPGDRIITRMDRTKDVKLDTLADGDTTVVSWQMKYPTILTGNHNTSARSSFRWNSTRRQYDTRFPGNSYHVVWFATNGFINDPNHPGYADTLRYTTILDGFTVQDGNASGATDVRQGGRDHTSMGGGIYMVKGSVVANCIIQNCSAAMRGGGVYLDGGGVLTNSLVRECQTIGTGVSGGYGGGVCIDNNGDVQRSWITRNVARMGGGIAVISYPENHPRGSARTFQSGYFDPYISASIVSNNTSTTEAGGIYLDRGGIVNHVTITRNENTGRDISYGRTRYGRSGGVYIYGAGQVFNSVIWGNVCSANNDIQYAATTSGVTYPSYISSIQPHPIIAYTAMNNLDITDFTGTTRQSAYSFETDNNDVTRSGNFTLFMDPPATAGAGIRDINLRAWYPYSKTSLELKSVQLVSSYFPQAYSVSAIARQDIFGSTFEPITTLGAIQTDMEDIETALVEPVNPTDAGTTNKIPTLFVNPNRVFNDPNHTSGASWDEPLDNIGEAIEYFRQHTPENGKFQILVKQGTETCAGRAAYYHLENNSASEVYLASVRMISNLLLYGGFPSTLTGTVTTGRNPKDYPTRLSGNIISNGYEYNAMHVVSFSTAHDAVLDGFQIYYGNARNTAGESNARGGGIVLGNQYYRVADRINMTDNTVRNCVIANCSGPQGAAVFAGGSYQGASGQVKASLKMENCVINNNESAASIINASGDASITMDHCTLVGNVGSLLATSTYNGTTGKITVTNSAFHGNARNELPLINNVNASDIATIMVGTNFTASNNLIDTLYNANYEGFSKVFSFNPSSITAYPSFVNAVRNVGPARNTDDNTVYGGAADYSPLDMNPMVNRASVPSTDHTTWGTDLTTQYSRDYGGRPDVGALECHQDADTRSEGGQPAYGSVVYVRDYNTYDGDGNVVTADTVTTGRDGTSWATAINGNAIYSTETLSNGQQRVSRGLQYAVDQAAKARGNSTSSDDNIEVWVSQGIYTNTSTDTVIAQYYAYRMAEGVDVIGGFPNYGNPSRNERSPKVFVSIIQPRNEDPTAESDSLIANSSKSVARVLVQPNDFNVETEWDGFTIRYGYLHSAYRNNIRGDLSRIKTERIGSAGGAGAYIMNKGVLENCELLHNAILVDPTEGGQNGNMTLVLETPDGGYHQAGAGAYITCTDTLRQEGGTLKNCVVAYNQLRHKFSYTSNANNAESAWMYGAGVYQNKGIIYNTTIHDNSMEVIQGNLAANNHYLTGGSSNWNTNEVLIGAGAFLVSGQFYNNTIVHNTAKTIGTNGHFRHIVIPGVYVYANITMYNSIVSDNTSSHANDSTYSHTDRNRTTHIIYMTDVPVCAFALSGNAANIFSLDAQKVRVHYSYIDINKASNKNLCDDNDTENTNIYIDYNRKLSSTPHYTSNVVYNPTTYNLVGTSPCVNAGDIDIPGVTIPSYDAAYADRVQDCEIDIGAYEYNGAELIAPREAMEPHHYYNEDGSMGTEMVKLADYFVNQNGRGDASASSPANAACATKLQKVLDAAGRYKYAHPKTHVVVRLEALPDSAGYTPSRIAPTSAGEEGNPRAYSIIVPMGVELQGGWKLNSNFGIDENGILHGRDPINNITRLTGEYTSGAETVNVYHIVTFTQNVYDENGRPTGQLLSDSIATYVPDFIHAPVGMDFNDARLDGLYIEGGRATGTTEADQRGAAAVLPDYAHITDCIVRDNQATGYGGAFYMMQGSVIEGSILEGNSAAYGGAVAVAEYQPGDSVNTNNWAFLLSNTISGNEATTRGGGLWFNNNARTMNSVYWNNHSAEQNDISGITTTSDEQSLVNCPVNFCAVTSQTIAGNNNISLSPNNARGTRWGRDPNLKVKHNYDFFMPSRASVLARTGMPYDAMRAMIRFLPGADSIDLAGVSRLQYTEADKQLRDTAYDGEELAVKYNYTMEIGARALNRNFSVDIDPEHPLYRLFVAHSENMVDSLANTLLESNDPVYSQQGSSFANPFLRLTDAMNYIINARKRYPEIAQNQRFEVFVSEGTYYPYADMLGQQQQVRSHTFVVPEKVTLIGGIDARDPNNMYCQDATDGDRKVLGDITLIGESTDSIRMKRERYDLNQNSVVEPWEMQHATILSGYTEGSDLTVQNVYHVITSIADSIIVGSQPLMYSDENLQQVTTKRDAESYVSRSNRAIIIDGLTITDGSAMNYQGSAVRNHNMYFRGGGIFVGGGKLNEIGEQGLNDMMKGSRNVPLVISNTLFQNNQARQGGAIFTDGELNIIGSSFVQNLAVSPSESETQEREYVSFSGGGAIATNDIMVAVNTIFANNEARDGGGDISVDQQGLNKRINVSANGKNANEIRAYGGVIWAGDSAAIRLINCNSVRNKAKAYASIYNCIPNTAAEGENHPHFGINCIFWGNEVDAGQDSALINYGDSAIGALYFSAYQRGKGLQPTVSANNRNYQGTLITNLRAINNLDDMLGNANHNVYINDDNDAVDGPNFTLPSNQAGVNGYMSSADWVPSRVNALTDAGWGMIRQDSAGVFIKEDNPDFPDATEKSYLVRGIYGWLSDFYRREYHMTMLPLGDEKYMVYADQTGEEGSTNMDRISSDPLGTVTEDYIDIGVYEYQHKLLHIADGDEVDELWVSDDESTGNNDGRSFDSPTSDLQRAIQTLLLSRNNHPKVIHIMQGTYSPIYELNNGDIGFVISTAPDVSSVALPDTIATGREYRATSITIMGGYSKQIEGLRDVNQYPTVLKMNRRNYATDANTAHLFYIANAEQWGTSGALSSESESSGQGSSAGSSGGNQSVPSSSVSKTSLSHGKAIPVVLDGLTFVNSFANANHKDLAEDGSSVDPTSGLGVKTAGAAIYYSEQFRSESSSVTSGTPAKSTTQHLTGNGDMPKLTIRNCKFTQNGFTGATSVPTVYIGKGGGSTLIYNSLFTSNTGAPLVSQDTVNIVNCTFAKNGGHITIEADGKNTSSLSNSLIWMDDSAATGTKTQIEGFPADSVKYNAITGITNTNETENNHNVGLSDANADPMRGPNFVNVTTGGTQALDYSINPGMRTMNRADSVLYLQKIAIIRSGMTDEDGRVILPPDSTWRYDLSWGDRIYGTGMDRGAYECRVQQQRVLYVIPTKTFGTMTGTSWENAYGHGQLQTAIDAAAIYSYSNLNSDGSKKMAYVLVKGEANSTSVENSISLRDGVTVYGSIPDDYLESIGDERATDDSQLNGYIDSMLAVRPGIAARSTRRSRIMGIQTLDDNYDNGSLIDGFEVWSSTPLSQPAVNITKPVMLSKLIIDGANVTGEGQPAINMDHGLMYNTLVYGNKPAIGQPVMRLGKDAAIINSTIVSNTPGALALSGSGLIANSITYGFNEGELSGGIARSNDLDTIAVNQLSGIPFAPYLTAGVNPYRLSAYITGFRPYQYQLNESTYSIAGGDSLYQIINAAQSHTASAEPYNYINAVKGRGWIDFDKDCDLLGNNRRLGRLIDQGCFETWNIRFGDEISATADNYPHEGSVVYIMDNANLSLGNDQSEQIFTEDNPFRPAFLLMRPGASLYGNGNVIRLAYVSTETEIDASNKYHILSLPFEYRIGEMLRTTIAANRQIDARHFSVVRAQTYNGVKRAQWNYHFNQDESECWEDIDTTRAVPANSGILVTMPDTISGRITLRLVGYGSVDGDYVYTENGTPKTITLTQHDERPTDNTAHFTKEENMGWNITGMPYLVSNYHLGMVGDSYNMNVPHILYNVKDDGTFSTIESWADDATLTMGNGFMTQTAINGNTETVTFALPVRDSNSQSTGNAKQALVLKADNDSEDSGKVEDVLQLNASESAKSLTYTLGNDGVKWLPLSAGKPSMYAVAASGTPLSLSSATPLDTDIPVVVTGQIGSDATISIADTSAFNGISHVWLRDDATGKVVDLKDEDLHIYADSTANTRSAGIQGSASFQGNTRSAGFQGITRNLTLRLGGIMRNDGNATTGGVHIFVAGKTLHVEGIKAGDRIDIFTISGQLFRRAQSSSDTFTTDLIPGVYVVRADNSARTIAVKR